MRLATSLMLGVLLTAAVDSAVAQQTRLFPLQPVSASDAEGLAYALDAALADELVPLDSVVLVGAPLADGSVASLDLQRVRVAVPGAFVSVDDVPRSGLPLEAAVTMWSGRVVGEPASDVYLAFSEFGSRGWIRSAAGVQHLLSRPGADGGWASPETWVVDDARLRDLALEGAWDVGVADLADARDGAYSPIPASAQKMPVAEGGTTITPLFGATVALETDTQYFDLFGDVDAAQAYAVELFGAASTRFREQIGVILLLGYIGLHTTDDDWDAQDNLASHSVEVLLEFADEWDAGDAPVEADLFQMLTGAPLSAGGVAFQGVVCHPDEGFGLSDSITGATPFPIAQGPLAWDFIVLAQSLGSNFDALRTHLLCPPLDQCAPNGLFGPCQTEQVCISDGTIMSFCYLCPGGIANMTPFYHEDIAAGMRYYVETFTCLQPFDGAFQSPQGFGLAGAAGVPSLSISYVDPGALAIDVTDAPALATAALISSPTASYQPFRGGTLVPEPTTIVPFATDAAGVAAFVSRTPPGTFPDGTPFWFQAWFEDDGGPLGYSASEGILLDLILSDPLPEPVWFAHPSNGMEYAVSTPGTFAMAKAQAEHYGGNLVRVTDLFHNQWLADTFAFVVPGQRAFFIGLTDEDSEGSFSWVTGDPLSFTFWGPGQPNNFGPSGQHYAELLIVSETLFETGTPIVAGQWNDFLGTGWFTNRGIMERPVAN